MSDTFTTDDFYTGDDGGDYVDDESVELPQVEVDDVTDDAGPESGQAEVTEQQTAEYLDLSTFSDKMVRVKVDGEEIDVPASQLADGWMRQADYTRKTQELAQQRQGIEFWTRVDQAFRVNPQKTLEYLAGQFGVEQAQAYQQSQTDDDGWNYGDDDDTEQVPSWVNELRREIEPLKQQALYAQAQQAVDQELSRLSAKYGDAFNADEVLTEAMNRGVTDPGLLEAVFDRIQLDRFRAQQAAHGQVTTEQQARDAARKAAAQSASDLVTQGAGASRGAAAPQPRVAQPRTVQEAWEMSKRELAAQGLI